MRTSSAPSSRLASRRCWRSLGRRVGSGPRTVPTRKQILGARHPSDRRASRPPRTLHDPGERSVLTRGLFLDLAKHLLREIQRLLSLVQVGSFAMAATSTQAAVPAVIDASIDAERRLERRGRHQIKAQLHDRARPATRTSSYRCMGRGRTGYADARGSELMTELVAARVASSTEPSCLTTDAAGRTSASPRPDRP